MALALAIPWPSRAGEPDIPAGAAPPASADALLEAVLDRLPAETLRIGGELRASSRTQPRGRRCLLQIVLSYGSEPAYVRYTVQDAFGDSVEQLTIVRARAGAPRFTYAHGTPLTEAPLANVADPIQGTDITWSDLSLAFLWWRGGRVRGTEPVLERTCYVVEVDAPPGEPSAYATARLWIDAQFLMLLQAEGLDAEGQVLRRLSVKSFKKIDDRWMIKDMTIETPAAGSRTGLRILEAVPLDQG